jgi:ribonucleotide reductase alpha subunit
MSINDKYFLSPAHLEIARQRYFLKKDGQLVENDIEEVFKRETDYIYQNDTIEHKELAFRLRCEKRILPAGRPLAQAGTDVKNLYNCFGLGFKEDTREAISELKRQHFNIQSQGGGTGVNFSILRPEGSILKRTLGHSSGAIGFIGDLSYQSSNVQQGGQRSGANLALIEDWHPDLYEFIIHKKEHNWEAIRDFARVNNEIDFQEFQWNNHYHWQMMNVSVALSNRFMDEVVSNSKKPWILKWKDEEWHLWKFSNNNKEYIVTAPDFELAKYKVSTRLPFFNNKKLKFIEGPFDWTTSEWFNLLSEAAYSDGCPGIVFIDIARLFHNGEYARPMSILNPCAEQVLPVGSSCNLTSLVLPSFWKDNSFDFNEFKIAIQEGVRGLDNLIDFNYTGEKEIDEGTREERRIGLGTTGIGELLLLAKLKYSSQEGRDFVGKILEFMRDEAYRASIELAKERGVFPAFSYNGYSNSKFFETLPKDIQEDIRQYGIHNVTILTQAPTGSTGTMVGYSQGCEPYFAMAYLRNSKVGSFNDGSPEFNRWLQEKEIDYSKYHYCLEELKKSVKVPKYFEEAQDIDWLDHLKMQAIFAKYIDSSVSKCLVKGTLIPTSKGLISVESFSDMSKNKEDSFNTIEEEYLIEGNRVLSHYKAGLKQARTIRLDNGSELTGATESHKVFTSEGWKILKNIKVGDLILGKNIETHGVGNGKIEFEDKFLNNSNKLPTPKTMTSSFAKFLGMIASDGHTTESTGYVGIACKHEMVEIEFIRLCEEVFKAKPNIVVDKRNNVHSVYLTSRNLCRLIEKLIGKGAYNKIIPTQILCGNKEEKIAFLEGLSLDGYYKKGYGLCVYEGMSKLLAYQTGEICRSFGLPTVYLGRKKVKGFGIAYSVSVSNKLQSLITCIEPHKNKDIVNQRYKVLIPKNGLLKKVNASDPHYSAIRNLRQRKCVSCFNNIAEYFGWPIETLVYRVTELQDIGLQEMYDIEVENSHEYIVNGIISHNTVNMSSDTTIEDVRNVFLNAYQLGIKSTTIYRDGSKTQILEHIKDKKDNNGILPRPDVLDCDIHHVTVRGEKWIVIVGLNESKPYEVFCAPQEKFEMSNTCKTGKVIKKSAGRYNLQVNDFIIKDIASLISTDEQKALTRMISLLLRNNISMNNIINQLHKANGTVVDFSKALCRALNKYQTEEERTKGKVCPECGSDKLVSTSGCVSCSDCGYSRCH